MGAGAGYSIRSTTIINSIQSLKLDNIVEAYTVDDGLVNFIAVFDCNIDCTVDDLEFESYNAGGKIEDIVQGTMTKIRLQFENAEIDSESQSDIAEWIERNQYKIRENLRNTRIGTDYLVGAGWIHQTFTGAITDLDDLDAIEHEYYYANDWSLFIEAAKIVVESNVAEYIDKAVTGETVTTIFYVEDEDFTELEAAKEYAIDNGYDKVMAYVDEEDFEGNFNTIDSYVAWRDEPVEDEFDDSLDEGIADMAMNAVQGFASKAADAASRFAGKVSDTINRVKAGNTGFQRAAGAWQSGLDKIGNKLAQTAYDRYYKPGFDQVDDYNSKTIPNIDGNKTQHTAKNIWKNWKPVDEYQADQKKKAEADKAGSTNANASTGSAANANNTGTNTNTNTNSNNTNTNANTNGTSNNANTNNSNQNTGAGSNTGSSNTDNKTGSTTNKTSKTYKYFSAEDDATTAKKKFRQFAMKYHPDREGGDEEKFKEMSNEYDHLFDSYNFRRFREGVERAIKRKAMRMNESKSNINEATTDEFKEIMSLAKQAGFKTAGELFKFKKEHEGEDLIQALRDRVGSNTEQEEKWVQVRLKGVDKEGYNYSGNGGRSWVTKDSTKVDTWPSKDDAIANGNKTFKKSFKYGTHWDVVKLDSDVVNEAKEEKEPIKEDSANGSVYGALYDTIQDAYDPITYDEAEYAIETAFEDGDIDEDEYEELMQELNETRDNADKFNNENLDELGKKFGLDYMFYKDRGEDVMLYAPDREDYEDEDAYEEKLEAFDDFLHYIEIDLDGDTEYFSETVTILHRW